MYAKKVIISVGFIAMSLLNASVMGEIDVKMDVDPVILKQKEKETLDNVLDLINKIKILNVKYIDLSSRYYKKVEDVNHLLNELSALKNNLSKIVDKDIVNKREELPTWYKKRITTRID